MKKKFLSMLLFVVLVVSCVALTGCGGKKDNPTEPNDGQPTTEITETRDPIDTEVTEPATEPTEVVESTEPEDVNPNAILGADGYYSWQVGNYTLRTKINVYDYIDESSGKWNANDMARALGWDGDTERINKPINKVGFSDADTDLFVRFAESNGVCNGFSVRGLDGNAVQNGMVSVVCTISTESYTMNDSPFIVSIEYIIISAYAMENSTSTSSDAFSGVAHYISQTYRFDQ